jgi:hypothetical protein
MRRVRRHLLNVLTALSLLLLVGVVVFGARSHVIGDELRWLRPPWIFEVLSSGGLVRVGWGRFDEKTYPPRLGWSGTFWPFERETDTYEFDLHRRATFGFGYERWTWNSKALTADTRLVTFPFWLPALVCAGLPAAAVVRLVRARRRVRRGGVCTACGYDLRATPGKCPECGAGHA